MASTAWPPSGFWGAQLVPGSRHSQRGLQGTPASLPCLKPLATCAFHLPVSINIKIRLWKFSFSVTFLILSGYMWYVALFGTVKAEDMSVIMDNAAQDVSSGERRPLSHRGHQRRHA